MSAFFINPFADKTVREYVLRSEDDIVFRVFAPPSVARLSESVVTRLRTSFRDGEDREREARIRELVKGPVAVRAFEGVDKDSREWHCYLRAAEAHDSPEMLYFACVLLPWSAVQKDVMGGEVPCMAESATLQVFHDTVDGYSRLQGFDAWCDRMFGHGKVRARGEAGFEWDRGLDEIWEELTDDGREESLPLVSRMLGGPNS